MPKQRTTFKAPLAEMWGFIALFEAQGRLQEANGVRLVMKWSGYRINEAAITEDRQRLTEYTRSEHDEA